jgi:O-acetylserine/cysteine efflux transporter
MPPSHALLALAVVAVWGTNFVVLARALAELPPFAFAALRFLFSCVPWILVLPRLRVAWPKVAGFGLALGVGQFGLLFLAMHGRLSPGVASVLVQAQVPLTVLLAAAVRRERVPPIQYVALAVACAGVGVIAWAAATTPGAAVTLAGVALALGAAAAWAVANVLVQSIGRVPVLSLMAWSSGFAVAPLVALSWAFDPPGTMTRVWTHASAGAWAAVAWQVVANMMFGYGAWNWLLARHPASTVAPMALLVPVFGLGSAALLAGEALPPWKLAATALIVGGVALNLWWLRRRASAPPRSAPGLREERPPAGSPCR